MTLRTGLLAFLALAPLVALTVWSFSPFMAIAFIFVSHMLILYPTLRPLSQWLGPVVTRFETAHQEVWLTIDDGPSPVDTIPMLDLLDRFGAHATFFVKGDGVMQHPDLAAAIIARGHDVQNHSQTHPSGTFWCLSAARIDDEVRSCNQSIAAATGRKPALFRAPVGMKNPFVHPLLERHGMRLVGWSVRGFDTVRSDAQRIAESIVRSCAPGDIVLLHQGRHDSAGRLMSLAVLERVLELLAARQFRFVVPAASQLVCGRLKTSR